MNDYGGYMSIGYDSAKVPAPATAPVVTSSFLGPIGRVTVDVDGTRVVAQVTGSSRASLSPGTPVTVTPHPVPVALAD